MKKILLLLAVGIFTTSLTGCAGCGCCKRVRDFFRRGAICGTRPAATAVAPAPIVYTQPAPVQQYVQPQPQVAAPQFAAPRVAPPQYAAPQMAAPQCCPPCVPCVPCCPPVCDPCYDPCGSGYYGGYTVGSPMSSSDWSSGDCCQPTYDGPTYDGPAAENYEPRPTLREEGGQQPSDPGPSSTFNENRAT